MLRPGARPVHAIKAQMAAECARADVRDERRVWTDQRQVRMRQQPYRLVFLDETYVSTKMTRLRGRSRKGEYLPQPTRSPLHGNPPRIRGS